MASVFVVRSRQPLLHYYSYPARRGYRRTVGNYTAGSAESNRPAPFASAEGSSGPSTRAVCVRSRCYRRCRTERRGGESLSPPPHFFLRAHVNQSGTIGRPSSARTYECNNEDIVKKCLSMATDFSCESVSATAATSRLDELKRRRRDVQTSGSNFFFNYAAYTRRK